MNPGFAVAHNYNGITFPNTAGVEYPLLGVGLRVGEPYQRADMQVQSVNLIDSANTGSGGGGGVDYGVFAWRLLLNPGLSGVPASTDIGKCTRHWEYTTARKLTGGPNGGGIELLGGFMTSYTVADVRTALNFLNLGSNVTNTDADKIVLVVRQVNSGASASPNVVASMNIIEAI